MPMVIDKNKLAEELVSELRGIGMLLNGSSRENADVRETIMHVLSRYLPDEADTPRMDERMRCYLVQFCPDILFDMDKWIEQDIAGERAEARAAEPVSDELNETRAVVSPRAEFDVDRLARALEVALRFDLQGGVEPGHKIALFTKVIKEELNNG